MWLEFISSQICFDSGKVALMLRCGYKIDMLQCAELKCERGVGVVEVDRSTENIVIVFQE